jgi:hypothetical protein
VDGVVRRSRFHFCFLIPHLEPFLHGGVILRYLETMSSRSKVQRFSYLALRS